MVEQVTSRMQRAIDEISKGLPEAQRIAGMISYSALNTGKMIRAKLLYETLISTLPKDTDKADRLRDIGLDFCAAIEFIHCYSLVHDDLPCMDDDDMRRGQESSHIKFGEANAVLCGDAMQNLAYEIMMKSAESIAAEISGLMIRSDFAENLPEVSYLVDLFQKINRASLYVARSAGSRGMISGQVLDIRNNKNTEMGLYEVKRINELKTGEMLKASAVIGAILGGRDDAQIDLIERCVTKIGLIFQITDDLLDITEKSEVLGKTAGSDREKGMNTYPVIMGVDQVRNYLDEVSAMVVLKSGELEIPYYQQLVEQLLTRSR